MCRSRLGQMDMVGYPANTNTPVGLTTDFVSTELSTFLGKCITTYSRLTHEPSVCGYACSDHASWTKIDVPSSFPFESKFGTSNPAIHTKNDVLANLSQDRCNEFARFATGCVLTLFLTLPSASSRNPRPGAAVPCVYSVG
jgi:leucyl aminopeptidase